MRRFDAYSAALDVLARAPQQDLGNEFVQSGIVDKFSLQFELGWKMLKDLLRHEGVAEAATGSPREVIKAAYRYFDFIDEEAWLGMLRDRNAISHTYDGEAMRQLVERILESYLPTLTALRAAVVTRYGEELSNIA